MKQFFYTRKEITGGTPEAPEFKIYNDSFNPEFIIRTISMEDGRRLVLLNDIHERSVTVPDINPLTNKAKGVKRERNTYQSEIYLEAEDSARFEQLMAE